MAEFILVSIVVLVWIIFARTTLRRSSAKKQRDAYYQPTAPRTPQPSTPKPEPEAHSQTPQNTVNSGGNLNPFSCRVTVTEKPGKEENVETFEIGVSGTIIVPEPMYATEIQVLLADTTKSEESALPVLCTLKKWQLASSTAFCYREPNGKMPKTEMILTDWVTVVNVPTEVLNFPHKGTRQLTFVTSLISQETGKELVCAETAIEYDNRNLGYIDVRQNAERTEVLSLEMALSLCQNTPDADPHQNETITEWIASRVALQPRDRKEASSRRLNSIFDDATNEPNKPRETDIVKICSELLAIATIVEIYDVMDLCLRVIGAGGVASPKQTELVSRIAQLLEVDETKFRAMTQKRLPLCMHQQQDLEFILGITADMTTEHRRKRLNDEYQKWNARVNHPDQAIQLQADQMLTLIAEARDRFTQTASA